MVRILWGHRREDRTKGLRKLYTKKLRNFYASLYISTSKRCAVYVAGTSNKMNAYKCGKGKEKCWESLNDKIRMVLVEMG